MGESLHKRNARGEGLLERMTIYVCAPKGFPATRPPPSVLREIVEAAGGRLQTPNHTYNENIIAISVVEAAKDKLWYQWLILASQYTY